MGEQAKKIGEKLEGFGEKLFTQLGWTELTRDKEIKCQRVSHIKRTHGIDIMLKFFDPYSNGMQGIIVECKNRQMKSITQTEIDKWVNELISNIECAQSAPELSDVQFGDASLNTGLLLIHANDKFDPVIFNGYLKKLTIHNRRNPINIYIANNDQINMWKSLLDKIAIGYSNNNFHFVYPSVNNSSKELTSYLTINSLYSKYIFAQNTYGIDNGTPFPTPCAQSIMFIFDDITTATFQYLWSMFKYYQLEGTDEYVFIFYPRKPSDSQYVKENFISTLRSIDNPIDAQTAHKIKIDFLDNRALSPIDTTR